MMFSHGHNHYFGNRGRSLGADRGCWLGGCAGKTTYFRWGLMFVASITVWIVLH
jgi:hypothetical protein